MLHGAVAAALTPLRAGGSELDEEAVRALRRLPRRGTGVDGILALGTTGEGVLLAVAERQRASPSSSSPRRAAGSRSPCTAARSRRRTRSRSPSMRPQHGADAVAVIAPPYFPLDDDELLAHFEAAARACAPLPFYVYEFAARSGYAVPLRGPRAPARAGAEPRRPEGVRLALGEGARRTCIEGLDVFIGAEGADRAGPRRRRRGMRSRGSRASFPDAVVPLVRDPSRGAEPSASVRCGRRSSGCRSTRRRRRRSGCAACPWGPTCARPCAGCATTSAPRSSGSSPTGSARDVPHPSEGGEPRPAAPSPSGSRSGRGQASTRGERDDGKVAYEQQPRLRRRERPRQSPVAAWGNHACVSTSDVASRAPAPRPRRPRTSGTSGTSQNEELRREHLRRRRAARRRRRPSARRAARPSRARARTAARSR